MSLFTGNQSNSEQNPRLKILVVDDDALNQQLMKILLNQAGHQVEVASNGLEACEAVKCQQFDIVFMDLRMPVMDGMQASRCIREWENGVRRNFIVALTASYLSDELQGFLEAGFDNYIAKPFELEQIHRMLKNPVSALSFPSSQGVLPDEAFIRPE